MRRGVPPRRDRHGRIIRGVRGDPGHLRIEIYSFFKKTVQIIELTDKLDFEIKNDFIQSSTNLKSGRIDVRFLKKDPHNLEVESILAIIFSISAIHVLLQPKEKPLSVPTPSKSVMNVTSNISTRPVQRTIINDYAMLGMFGYYPLISSDCFIHHCHHHDHCHNHEHHHNIHDNDHNFDHGIAICPTPSTDQTDQTNDNFDTNAWLSGDIEGVDKNNTNGGIDSSDGTYVGGCGGCGSGGGIETSKL